METKLKIEYKSIDEIVPYINNTKKHPQSQIDKIKASILEFGMCNPILIHNNTIIAGHGRYEALRQLGYKEVPTIDLSHLSEAQRKAYIIADNRIGEFGEWDEELLKIELQELKNSDLDFDIEEFEFDIELDEEFMSNIDESKADEVPEVDEDNIVIKRGDLIELGHNYQHRLLCGDSTSEDDVKKLMGGGKADMVFTDPPYGVSYKNNMSKKFDVIKNDDVFLDAWIPLLNIYSDGFIFVWTSYQVVDEWIKLLKNQFKKITNIIIWHKGGGGLGDLKGSLSTDYELGLIINRGKEIQGERESSFWDFTIKRKKSYIKRQKKEDLIKIIEKTLDSEVVWNVKKDNTISYLHPTQKPVEVFEKGLEKFTKKYEIVLDLFLGSGSTLIACENLSRKCYGMELDEKYAQVIIQRYVDYTSNPKIKINGVEVDWYEYKEKGE